MSFRISLPIAITPSNTTTNATDATAAWNSGTTYALAAPVKKNYRIYQSLQSGNTNHDPETDTTNTWWLDIGPTNDWAMFDDQLDTQTTRADDITVSVVLGERIDTLGLFNIDAASVTVALSNGYSQVFSMVNYTGIVDYWDHFFNRVSRRRTLIVDDLPNLSGLTLTVTISAPGGTAGAGHMVAGLSRDLGNTAYGATLGYISFSKIAADDFGRRAIVKRNFKKQGSFEVWIERAYVSSVYDIVTSFDATPVLITATEDVGDRKAYEAAAYFGPIIEANITIAYPDYSIMRISVEDF